MSGNPGNTSFRLTPTPPERGSFPLDHDGECSKQMMEYIKCIKLVKGENGAVNCRIKARDYLKCRMDNNLMDKDEFKNLGLPERKQGDKSTSETRDKNFGE